MPIYKGTTNLSLAKGTIPISSVYKGTTLVYSSYTWEQWYQTFLYNALIPQTINSKNVLNQAKVVEVEGNGVVENQLFYPRNSGTPYGITITNNGDGSLTFNGTATSNGYPQLNDWDNHPISLLANHKYLILGGTSALSIILGSFTLTSNGIIAPTSNITTIQTSISNGTTYNETKYIQLIDLTLMFGTGNEPTALTDTRIQALLNRGYIPYNTGKYKGTDIGVISSEPYNLFDLDRTAGTGGDFSNTTPRNFEDGKYYIGLTANNYCSVNTNSNFSISNNSVSFATNSTAYGVGFPIKVVGGKKYIFDYTSSDTGDAGTRYISWYDKDGNFISFESGGSAYSKTAPQNAYWGVALLRPASQTTTITYTNICFHVAGTRTGYAPHTNPQTLSFKYQGNGAINTHDTFEITSSAYVFTRNVGNYTFSGSETANSWRDTTNNYGYLIAMGSSWNTKTITSASLVPNIMFQYLPTETYGNCYNQNVSNAISVASNDSSNNNRVVIRSSTITTSADLLTWLAGKQLQYELATPQVISIPKKHLGIVDLGSLNWAYYSGTSVFWAAVSDIKVQTPNLFCIKYLTQGYVSSSANLQNGYIGTNMWTGTGNQIIVKDSSYSNATDFKTAMSGVYLFYETDAETTDIDTKIGIESGGTITSNWFSWKKNQLVSNGNFVDFSNWNTSGGATVYSVANNILTFKAVQRYGGVRNTINIISEHKYLIWYELKMGNTPDVVGHSVKLSMTNMATAEINPALNTSWQTLAIINTANSGQTQSILYIRDYAESGWVDNQCKNINVVDLTLAFGSGNEPTSTSDPRIQYIISNGYIPTDTTGTDTLVDSQVLPNIEFGVKAK